MKSRSIPALLVCAAALISAGPIAAHAQQQDLSPRIGGIEIYGAHHVSEQKIRAALGVAPGDPISSRDEMEQRIDKVHGVLASRVEAVCCEGERVILYVGIEDRDAAHFEFRAEPTGSLTLPDDLWAKYREFLDVVADSMRAGKPDEDLTNGYSLMADSQARDLQMQLIPLVARDLVTVDKVLRESSDADQRAAAAYLMQYGPRGAHTSKTVVDALQFALRDPDDPVRANALRALKAVAVGGRLHPEQQIHIEPTWLIELLNSVVWSDRRAACLALVDLTDKGDRETLDLLRQRALTSIIEMARWKDLRHALPAFILAGRIAGLNEKEIHEAWIAGDREAVLHRALHPGKQRRDAADPA